MSENIRLLLVEDNPGDVRLIQEYLKDVPMMNLELGVVDTLEEAQKVLEEDNIDLVLLDLGLPDSAGLDTVVEVISQNPSVPVVVLTGLADNRRAMEAINGGAQDYLVKDLINTDVLVRSIRYSVHRKQSRVEIEESEEKYRSLWDNSANGLAYHELVTDDDGKPIDSIFLDVNTSFEKITGRRREDIIGKRFSEVKDKLLPADFDLAETFWKVAFTGEPTSIEFHNQKTQRWFSVSVYSPSRGTFVNVLQDITQRKIMEEKLRESEAKFKSSFENAGIGMTIVSLDNQLTETNPAMRAMLGYNEIEMSRLDVKDFSHPQDMELDNKYSREAIESRSDAYQMEKRYFHKSGETIWGRLTWTLVRDHEGNPNFGIGMVEDITARKKSEQALIKSETRFRGLFDKSPIGIELFNIEGLLIDANQATLDIFGVSSIDDVKGFKLFEDPNITDQVKDQLRKGESVAYQTEFDFETVKKLNLYETSRSGIVHLDLMISPMILGGGNQIDSYIVHVRDITETRMVQEALEESENLYRLLAENTFDSIWQMDLNTKFNYVNPAIFRVFGFTPEEWIGTSLYEHCSPEAMKLMSDKMLEAVVEGSNATPITFETRMLRKDGTEIDVEITGNLILDDNKEPLGFQGTTRDITERKQAEEQLRESEAKFRSVFEDSAIANNLHDSAGILIEANQACVELFGVQSAEDLQGFNLFDDPNLSKDVLERVKSGETVRFVSEFSFDKVKKHSLYKTSKSGIMYIDTVLAPFGKTKQGSVLGYYIQMQDITDKVRASEVLAENEKTFRTLFEDSPLSYQSLDTDGNFLHVNKKWLDTLGYSKEEVIGHSFADFLHIEDSESFRVAFPQFKKVGEVSGIEFRMRHGDGSYRDVSFEGLIRYDEDGKAISTHCVFSDITEKKKAEADLKFERARYISVLNTLDDGIYVVDKNYEVEYINQVIERDFGPVAGRKCYAYLHDRKEPCPWCKIDEVFAGNSVRWEWYSERNDRYYDLLDTPMKNADGSISKFEIFRDITETRKAQEALERTSRSLRALNSCNEAIVQSVSEPELYSTICKAIVEKAGYRLAWVGKALHDEEKKVIPICQSGFEEGYLEKLNISWADIERGRGPTGLAIRTGKYSVSRNIQHDPKFKPWKEDAIKRGYASSISLPLTNSEGVFGALNIYASEPNAFDIDEIDMLVKMSETLSHAVAAFHVQEQKRVAQDALEISEERYRSLFENMLNGYAYCKILIDDQGKPIDFIYLEVNDSFEKLTGLKRNDVVGKKVTDAIPGIREDTPELFDIYGKVAQTGEPVEFEIDFTPLNIWLKITVISPKRGYFVAIFDNITERKLAEETIRQSEEKYRVLYEKLSDALFLSDKDGRITLCNDMSVNLFGYNKEELLGIHFTELLHPEDSQRILESHEKHLKTGEAIIGGFDAKARRKDGSYFDVHITNTILMEQGKASGYQSLIHDITERKRAAEALEENETRFRLLFETAPLATTQVNLTGTIYQVNNAFETLFGYSKEESKHITVESITHPDDWELETKLAQEMDAGLRDSFEIEKRFFHKDGHQIWGNLHVSIARDSQGNARFVVGTVEDITDRKKNEEALRKSEERQRLVLSSMSDLIFVLDKNDNYVEFYASDDFAPISSPDEFLGKNVKDVLPPEVANLLIESANRVRETGIRETVEYALTQNEKEDWFLAALDRHQDSESIVMVARNITNRKRAQDDVKERESEYRTLVSNIPGAVYHCAFDEHWTMFFLSDAFENISGYPASDFIMNQTRSFNSVIHPDDRDFVTDEITKSVNQKEIYGLEYRIIYSDGTIRWIREQGQGIPDREGKISYLDGIFFDITEEKLAQKEMTRLRDIQQASFELSLALGETLELDKIYKTIYNHIEQLMDTSIFIVSFYDWKTKHITAEYVITDEGPVDVKNLPPIPLEDEGMGTQSQVIRSGQPLYLPNLVGALEKTKTEYTLKSGGDVLDGSPPDNGKQRSRSVMCVPLLHANEVIGVMQVQSYNINAYSQDQLELLSNLANVVALAVQNAKLFETVEESEDRFRLLVEGTLDGIFIHENMVFLDVNRRMAEMIGKDRADLIGTNIMDYWTPESKELIHEYVRSGSDDIIELDLLRSDGSTCIVEALSKECLYNGKKARIVATRNITEQQKAQQETKQAADTALLYLDIMSHDVRNQLQAVIMASEIMQHLELGVESILALEIITESVEKSEKLINKVLSTRELLSVPLSEFSLKTALRNSLESLNKIYEDIEIETKCTTKDTKVNADKFIEQLLLNILENAVEYNERKDRKLWIDIQESGQGFQVSIKDNGQGISDAKKESLFDPSRRFGGVGIHQTIRILQKYGGHISVHDRVASDSTQGAEFRIWFPKLASIKSSGK